MKESDFKSQIANSSQDVLSFYDAYAESWDERFGNSWSTHEFHRVRLESFLRLARLEPGQRIVELGVGTGAYLDIIAPRVREVICIDGSQRMLDVLKDKHPTLANLTIRQCDLEHELSDAGFDADLVYWFGLLEHIIGVDTFLENCSKMLGPRGRVVLVAPNGKSPWYGPIRRLWRSGRHCSTDRYYAKEECDAVFLRHGFTPETAVYWGYAPAGIGDSMYRLLSFAGNLIDRTWLRRYAGGLTISYRRRARQELSS